MITLLFVLCASRPCSAECCLVVATKTVRRSVFGKKSTETGLLIYKGGVDWWLVIPAFLPTKPSTAFAQDLVV